jgi:hypothetical protein
MVALASGLMLRLAQWLYGDLSKKEILGWAGTIGSTFIGAAWPSHSTHLYEIDTVPQKQLISAVLSAQHIIELARLHEFLT